MVVTLLFEVPSAPQDPLLIAIILTIWPTSLSCDNLVSFLCRAEETGEALFGGQAQACVCASQSWRD